MTTNAADRPKIRLRRPRRKLNTPVNLTLAAILIGLTAFWLGGKLNGKETASQPMPGAMPTGGMLGSTSSGDSTQGEVSSLSGNTLYVKNQAGTTVKVKVSSGATVTRNAEVEAGQIRPGDTVTVTGKETKAGVVRATAVTATESGVESAMPSFGGPQMSSSG